VITVVGRQGGRELVRFSLGHGDDPVEVLAGRGWSGTPEAVDGVQGRLVLRYAVEPMTGPVAVPSASRPEGPGLTHAERRRIVPHQRVAAYAVVVAEERLLLTQLAPRTGAPGRWNLPGGGVDPGEAPVDAVVREVAEETGQVVDTVRLVDVMTQHWVGRSARGLEDYHAVRLLHTARCPRPTRPVVHDVGGSTSDARWVPLDDLGSVEVVESVKVALVSVGLVGDRHWAQS
jgi:8-oxo-dGTP diphosphatase